MPASATEDVHTLVGVAVSGGDIVELRKNGTFNPSTAQLFFFFEPSAGVPGLVFKFAGDPTALNQFFLAGAEVTDGPATDVDEQEFVAPISGNLVDLSFHQETTTDTTVSILINGSIVTAATLNGAAGVVDIADQAVVAGDELSIQWTADNDPGRTSIVLRLE